LARIGETLWLPHEKIAGNPSRHREASVQGVLEAGKVVRPTNGKPLRSGNRRRLPPRWSVGRARKKHWKTIRGRSFRRGRCRATHGILLGLPIMVTPNTLEKCSSARPPRLVKHIGLLNVFRQDHRPLSLCAGTTVPCWLQGRADPFWFRVAGWITVILEPAQKNLTGHSADADPSRAPVYE
jgi:hypothetical protein